jgi:hypothetical protein
VWDVKNIYLLLYLIFLASLSFAQDKYEKSYWLVSKMSDKHMLVDRLDGDLHLNKKFSALYDAAAPVAADKDKIVIFAAHPSIKNAVLIRRRMSDLEIKWKGWEWRWFIWDKGQWIDASKSMFGIPGYDDTLKTFGINPNWVDPKRGVTGDMPIAYKYPFDRFNDTGPVYEVQEKFDTKCEWKQKEVENVDVTLLESIPSERIVYANGKLFWRVCRVIKKKVRVKIAE